jgi:hypothetical protein
MGLLSAITIAMALIMDFFMLPTLLMRIDKKQRLIFNALPFFRLARIFDQGALCIACPDLSRRAWPQNGGFAALQRAVHPVE